MFYINMLPYVYQKDKEFQYEVLCDGFEVTNYTFILESVS